MSSSLLLNAYCRPEGVTCIHTARGGQKLGNKVKGRLCFRYLRMTI